MNARDAKALERFRPVVVLWNNSSGHVEGITVENLETARANATAGDRIYRELPDGKWDLIEVVGEEKKV